MREDQEHRVVRVALRQINVAERIDEPKREGAEGRAAQAAHTADDHDDQRDEQVLGVVALVDRDHRAAEHTSETGEEGADEERSGEDELDVDPERRDHVPVVDAGSHDHPVASSLDDRPEDEPNGDRRQEDEDPEERIAQPVDRELHTFREHARRRELLRDRRRSGPAPGRR